MTLKARVLLIACGALAREIVDLQSTATNGRAFDIQCLPAKWHNTPQSDCSRRCREKIHARPRARYENIYVLYGDCGTGGQLDALLKQEEGVERIAGPHCYAFFSWE